MTRPSGWSKASLTSMWLSLHENQDDTDFLVFPKGFFWRLLGMLDKTRTKSFILKLYIYRLAKTGEKTIFNPVSSCWHPLHGLSTRPYQVSDHGVQRSGQDKDCKNSNLMCSQNPCSWFSGLCIGPNSSNGASRVEVHCAKAAYVTLWFCADDPPLPCPPFCPRDTKFMYDSTFNTRTISAHFPPSVNNKVPFVSALRNWRKSRKQPKDEGGKEPRVLFDWEQLVGLLRFDIVWSEVGEADWTAEGFLFFFFLLLIFSCELVHLQLCEQHGCMKHWVCVSFSGQRKQNTTTADMLLTMPVSFHQRLRVGHITWRILPQSGVSQLCGGSAGAKLCVRTQSGE